MIVLSVIHFTCVAIAATDLVRSGLMNDRQPTCTAGIPGKEKPRVKWSREWQKGLKHIRSDSYSALWQHFYTGSNPIDSKPV